MNVTKDGIKDRQLHIEDYRKRQIRMCSEIFRVFL